MHKEKEVTSHIFNDAQKKQFVRDGFVKLENAFPQEVAAEARAILWRESGCDPQNRATWTRPVVRLGDFAQEPFRQAANTPTLHAAFDALVGAGRWVPRTSLGGFPIRFPHVEDPGDTGWHVDASFPPDHATDSYLDWRVNVQSKGRALLMLFLFSDVGEEDAPTRIRVGSHLRVARLLAPAGEDGMSILELARLAVPGNKRNGRNRRDRESGNSIFMPSVPAARGTNASRRHSAFSCSTSSLSKSSFGTDTSRWRLLAGRTSNSSWAR